MIPCPFCAEDIDAGLDRCPKCGEILDENRVVETPGMSRALLIALTCFGLTVVLVGGASVFLFLGFSPTTPAPVMLAPTGPQTSNAIHPNLGDVVLLQQGRDLVALRLLKHTTTKDGGVTYEWVHQGDGTNDLTVGNVNMGTGEVFEDYRAGTNRGQLGMTTGPFTFEWSLGDWLYYLDARSTNAPAQEVRMCLTPWTQFGQVDLTDPSLTWVSKSQPFAGPKPATTAIPGP